MTDIIKPNTALKLKEENDFTLEAHFLRQNKQSLPLLWMPGYITLIEVAEV
jgi:hypothetical protein